MKSTVRILLPYKVEQQYGSVKIYSLGFVDPSKVPAKANGLSLQVKLMKDEDLSHTLFGGGNVIRFDVVDNPGAQGNENTSSTPNVVTQEPSGMEGNNVPDFLLFQ